MTKWLERCEVWITRQYQTCLGLGIAGGPVRIRWLAAGSLTQEVERDKADSMAVEDSDIGWIFFLLPYVPEQLERAANEALTIRSRLLREANYTGFTKPREIEDPDSSWRVGLIWLVQEKDWPDWQSRILQLRRESGAAEEISIDALCVTNDAIEAALDLHGLPRLLLHTRSLLGQSANDVELWLSADQQVRAQLETFSSRFQSSRARTFARQLEEQAKNFKVPETLKTPAEARRLSRFRVRNFRNLKNLELAAEPDTFAQAIVLYGPNGTGKSSLAEAISLAAFGSSPRLDQFLTDGDVSGPNQEQYLEKYLKQCVTKGTETEPSFVWGSEKETLFSTCIDMNRGQNFEGVVLSQEASIRFTQLPQEQLAAHVLRGYSSLADHLGSWLTTEEQRAHTNKLEFTRRYGLSGAIKHKETAYERLAQLLLAEQLPRPSAEYLDWLDFLVRLGGADSENASELAAAWRSFQIRLVGNLATSLSELQAIGASAEVLSKAVREALDRFDELAERSGKLNEIVGKRIGALRDQVTQAIAWVEAWGAWLATRKNAPTQPDNSQVALQEEREKLRKTRVDIEEGGKALRARLEILETTQAFLSTHWSQNHPDSCPVCNSNVADRHGIQTVVTSLLKDVSSEIEVLKLRDVEAQIRQEEIDVKLAAIGSSISPVRVEDQEKLKTWLAAFFPNADRLQDWLSDARLREQLKNDIRRMRNLPNAPRAFANSEIESMRLVDGFLQLSNSADGALNDPPSIEQVKKVFEERMEAVLVSHLPKTLGKVWQEISLTLTAADWLLPARPTLKLGQRGKALSVLLENRDLLVRYIYNVAEQHVLGLAWFFTFFIARRRFEEAWILLDDPAQEMDQPSFRELVRFWETLLRVHRRKSRPLTLLMTLHQEERALDAARGTNARLYVLGWQRTQDDSSSHPSVKKIVLLAPGYHPLKPDRVFT